MEKNKSISVDEFKNAIKSDNDGVASVNFNGLDVEVKRVLTAQEVEKFVETCSDACFVDGGGYFPEAKDMAIDCCIVAFYTNIDLSVDATEQYDLITKSGIIDDIIPYIDDRQLNMIVSAIREKNRNRSEMGTNYIVSKVDELCENMNVIEDNMSKMFDGISPEDVKGLVSAISSNGFDENKIAEAYLKKEK